MEIDKKIKEIKDKKEFCLVAGLGVILVILGFLIAFSSAVIGIIIILLGAGLTYFMYLKIKPKEAEKKEEKETKTEKKKEEKPKEEKKTEEKPEKKEESKKEETKEWYIYCKECGEKMPVGSKHCNECGTKQ